MSIERDTRQKLLEAAGELFSQKGLDGTTTKEICDKAGVNIASVNYYFGSKENLYVEAVKAALPNTIREVSRVHWSEGTPPEQKLRDFIFKFVQQLVGEESPWKARLVMREMANPLPACRVYFRRHVQQNFAKLLSIVEELLPPDTPLHRRYQFALSVVSQCVHYRASAEIIRFLVPSELYEQYFDAEHLAEHISQVCLAALGVEKPLVERWKGTSEDKGTSPALTQTSSAPSHVGSAQHKWTSSKTSPATSSDVPPQPSGFSPHASETTTPESRTRD